LAPAPDTASAIFLAPPPNPPAGTAKPYFWELLGFDTASIIQFDDFDTGTASQICGEAVVCVGARPWHNFPQETSANNILVNIYKRRAGPFNNLINTALEVRGLLR
jgi:hypothetical protein